jgi:lipid-A-disaccharide synthase
MKSQAKFNIGIVAGEPSGDALGAGLIEVFSRDFPGAVFYGIGGPKMRKAGCDTLYDMDRIELMGLDGILGKIGGILKIRSSLYRNFTENPLDIFIGIDVPDFNLSLESRLSKKGIKTVHYVSPTVWAWRGYRIHKIRRAVGHMLALFPFEADYYTKQRIPVTCVGHPIADEIDQPDRQRARQQLGLAVEKEQLLVGLLPGSRRSEVDRLGKIFIDAARIVYRSNPGVRFVLPFASTAVRNRFLERVGNISDLPITFLDGESRKAMEAADLLVLASGTAALEASLLERPHVVAYRVSAVTWWMFRLLRHIEYYSMSNQLLPQPLVPEFIQHDATPEKIAAAVQDMIEKPQALVALEREFRKIREQLKLDANVQAARAISRELGFSP